ncbi:MAG: hypothetical protein IJH50_09070 [Kiritimatiellae bacterium]|nr:hypothetical protein [Kiritimatiellia bacterium]
MKAIGYIKMVNNEKGFGFIYTIPLSVTEHKTIDVHFKLREWCEKYEPEVGMCVYFGRKNGGAKGEEAVQVVELSLSRNHLCLALDYAVHGYKILGFDKKTGKTFPRNVLHDLLARSTGNDEGAKLIRDVVSGFFRSHPEINCESVIDKLAKSNMVRETLISVFDKGCEDCDERILNAIRHLKERKIEEINHKRSHGRFIGIVKWFAPGKDGSGQGYIVTNRHGYADLKNAQGELIEPRFDEEAWLEKDIRPRQDDVVIYERGGRFGEVAIKVRLLTDSVDDLIVVFRYAPESIKIEGKAFVSSRSDRPPKDYKVDLLNYASRKVLMQHDRRKALTTFSEALSYVDEQRRIFICEKLILDSCLAVKLRELFFNDENKVEDDIVSKLVRAKLLASLKETMLAEQERLIEECELNYWRDANNDGRLIGRFAKSKTKVEDVRFPTFGRLKKELSVVTNYIPSGSEEYCFFEWKFSNNNPNCPCQIETVGDPVPITAQEIVDMVRKQVDKDPDTRIRYEGAVETIRNQLVGSGAEVFIYELLQNADDYPYGNDPVDVEIVLTNEYLIFRHSGRSFGAENVAAICDINAGEKTRKRCTIGYKGIGFKTVFAGTDCVYIKTGEYTFAFDRRESEKKHIPWEVTPYWRTDDEINDEVLSCLQSEEHKYRVNIAIHPDSPEQISGYASVLNTMFSDEKSILFLRKVRSVSVKFVDGSVKCVSNDGGVWERSRNPYFDRVSESARRIIEGAVAVNNPKIPKKYIEVIETGVSVSFACRVDYTNPERLELENDEGSTLYCYLPAKNAQWGFGFIFNSDMIPNGRRDDIELKDEYDTTNPAHDLNLILARQCGSRFFDWVEELLATNRFSYESLFALIPNFDKCMRDHPKYKDFINEFRSGFKSRLGELKLPNEEGKMLEARQFTLDETEVVSRFSDGFVSIRSQFKSLIPIELSQSKSFRNFLTEYSSDVVIDRYTYDRLRADISTDGVAINWLKDASNNKDFIRYLARADKLDLFLSAPVFLDNHGELGCASDMYGYSNDIRYLEERLPEFVGAARYLSPEVSCDENDANDDYLGKLKDVNFKAFGPRTFIRETILARGIGPVYEESREKLKDIRVSKRFWAYIAHYRLWENRQRFEDDYQLLSKLPFVDEDGMPVDSFESEAFSVYVKDESSVAELVKAKWYVRERVKVINSEYFVGDEGRAIKDFFCDGKVFKNSKQLAYGFNTLGCYLPLAVKFKDEIKDLMLSRKDDLGFYNYLSMCFSNNRISHEKMKARFCGFPVLDTGGQLIDREGKAVFYYGEELSLWLRNGWIKEDAIVVLNEKYSSWNDLFDLLGARKYVGDNFGEIFRTLLVPHLDLDSREKVIAFHRFMATKKNLLNDNQVAELKKAPILVQGHVEPVDGLNGVYLPKEIDRQEIDREIAAGIISADTKILDNDLYGNDDTYWGEKLRVKPLNVKENLKLYLEKYLERQKEFLENSASDPDFKEFHRLFICELASKKALEIRKDSGCGAAIKKVGLFAKDGKLRLPTEMRFSNEYMPLCDFESFDNSGTYVSELYCGIENISELFKELGVKGNFSKEDVALLANKEFCEYFWTKYLAQNKLEWSEVKDCLRADLPCVLDRTGEVRKPEELYHLCIEDYVLGLSDSDSKLPMMDGIDKDCLSELEMKISLSVEDSLAFLLSDSECKMYNKRGRVLQWIADGCSKVSHDLAEKYRNDELAKWRNRQKEVVSVKELCAIRRDESSSRVRLFANNPHVMDLMGRSIGIPGEDAGTMWRNAEEALVWLGVEFVDHDSIIFTPDNKKLDDKVISAISVRMLVFLAERYPDAWEHEFDFVEQQLKNVKFYRCNKLLVQCRDIEWLRAEYGTFLPDNGIFYSAEDWLHPLVYCDVIARLGEDVFRKRYSIDDLKIALYAEGGDKQIAKRISSDTVGLLADEQFMKKLQKLFPDVHGMVCDMLRENESASNQTTGEENQSGAAEAAQPVNEEMGKDEIPPQKPETKKNYSEEEQEQMYRVFGNDLTPDQMNDINRIDCIRLFNSLMRKGLAPKYLIGGNDQREKMYGDNERDAERDFVKDMFDKKQKRKIDHSATIETNDGRIIHVVGAINGVAHLPPRWWTRLAKQNDKASAKYVVCAVVYHQDDGFQYLETRGELMDAIGDNFTVIRVQSELREERFAKTLALFGSNPECSDYSTYSLLLLHKMKSDRSYECVFTKEFGNESINEW